MSEGPTIGDWTQYGWIPDDASTFPARVRLRNAAWMVYYEPDVVVKRERAENLDELLAENAKLRELVRDLWKKDSQPCMYLHHCNPLCPMLGRDSDCEYYDRMRELGVEVDV